MSFSENKKYRVEYLKLYNEAFEYYKSENMNIREIELEISRLESKIQNHSNPGLPIVASFIVLVITLFSSIFNSIEYKFDIGSYISWIIIIVCYVLTYLFMKFTDKLSDNTTSYSARIKALEDLKYNNIKKINTKRKFIK